MGKKSNKASDTIASHVSDRKKKLVKDLAGLLSKKTIMVVSVKNLPSSQFQDIRKKLRGKAELKVAKKSLIDFALEHAKNNELLELTKYVQEDCAMLFSEEDAFELAAFLADNKSPAKAKIGQISTEEITIEPGVTDLLPGPAITELSSAGLKVKVEGGKIAISEEKLFIKVGEIINEQKAGILSKLNIIPFKIGLEPIAAFSEGKVYANVKVDRQANLGLLREMFARSLAFAVTLNYASKETIMHLLGKAASHEKALLELIKSEAPVEQTVAESQSN